MKSLLNDYTFLTMAVALLPFYCGAMSAVLVGLAGKFILGVNFGTSFVLAIIVLVLFYLSELLIQALMFTALTPG